MRFHQAILDNGLEVIAEENDSAFSTSVGVFVKTGARHETAETAGVSHFLEHMLFKGGETLSAEGINRRLDELGADANAFTTEEQTVYYATALPEMQHGLLELFAELLQPALRTDDFETEKKVILEEINMYEDQPPFGADETSRALFFGDHPLANNVLGSVDSVSALTVETLREYFESHYRADNIVLVATGRVDFEAFVEQAKTMRFGDSPQPNTPSLRRVQGRRGVRLIRKESAAQQYSLLLSDGPSALDADRFAAGILTNILGDEVGSRLYWELIDTGLADSVGLGVCEFLDNGFFLTTLSCEPELTGENLQMVRNIYSDAVQDGVSSEELNRAKNKILSRLVLSNERSRGRLFAVGNDWSVRREYRPLLQDLDDVRCVSMDDVHTVLKKYPLCDSLLVSIGSLTEI